MTPPPRTPHQRKQEALQRLEQDIDAWVATADLASGTPYLVPVSVLWDGRCLGRIVTPRYVQSEQRPGDDSKHGERRSFNRPCDRPLA